MCLSRLFQTIPCPDYSTQTILRNRRMITTKSTGHPHSHLTYIAVELKKLTGAKQKGHQCEVPLFITYLAHLEE